MPRRNLLSICLFALIAVVCAAGEANAANALEKGFSLNGPRYDSNVPPCDAMLDEIAANFIEKEGKFWNSALYITGFSNIREIAFRPWESGNIPRRFCTAQVAISDGKVRPMNYSIIEDGGVAGIGSGVEFCIVGLDRN